MDSELLVENQIDDGLTLLSELVRNGFELSVAVWVRRSEQTRWSLYVASETVSAETLGNAYGLAYACLSKHPESTVGLSEIKFIHASNPIARDAIAVRDRKPGRILRRYNGIQLGDLSIEEAYVYPKIG